MFNKHVKTKDIDFLQAYLATTKSSAKWQKHYKYMILPICMFLFFGCGFGYVKYQEYQLNKDIKEVEKKIDDLKDKQVVDNSEAKYKTFKEVQQIVSTLKDNKEKIDSYPEISKQVMDTLLTLTKTMEIQTLYYDQTTGGLSLTVKAKQVALTNTFIRNLRETNLFENILYTGYQFNEETNTQTEISSITGLVQQNDTKDTYYVIKVTCVLKEGA